MRRYLVVIDHTLGGQGLWWAAHEHAVEEGSIEVDVVVPAEQTEAEAAERRLAAELEILRSDGIPAQGKVVIADAFEAIRAAAEDQEYDGVIIATHSSAVSRWLHLDLPRRVERELQIPVEWIEARTDDPAEDTTINIELPREAMRASDEYPPERL